ncbi:MAG: hypothetical protein KJ879_00850 [Nanoarchaeota archaeon]|nr:hypothetical protein [Nanoarchaeota archaeon]
MAKGKLSTPDWIREGFDSKADWEKAQGKKSSGSRTPTGSGKTFKVKTCPKCGDSEVKVVIDGKEDGSTKDWECKSCSLAGKDIKEKEMSEDEFIEHIEKMEAK